MVLLRVFAVFFSAAAVLAVPTVVADPYPLYGFASLNGGTTGGAGGKVFNVTTTSQLTSAIAGDSPKIVYVKGLITASGTRFKPGPNTSIIGVGNNSGVSGSGFSITSVKNVIIRNLIVRSVTDNDGITIQTSTNVWIDHNEFSSDLNHGPDYYDGALDIVKGSDYVTVSGNYFHDHWKNSLVGSGPEQGSTDKGHLRITYFGNYFARVYTRTPALRFGMAHVVNNLFEDVLAQGIHTRSSGQVLVESNVFRNAKEALSTYGKVIPEDSPNTSPEGDYEPDGFANLRNNDFGGSPYNLTATGTFTSVPYTLPVASTSNLQTSIRASAGVGKIGVGNGTQSLTFAAMASFTLKIESRRNTLASLAKSFADDVMAGKPFDILANYFSTKFRPNIKEHGDPSLAPYLGRTFHDPVEFGQLLLNLTTRDDMTLDVYLVDLASSRVCFEGTADLTWKETGDKYSSEFIWNLEYDDEGKIVDWEIWTDHTGAPYMKDGKD